MISENNCTDLKLRSIIGFSGSVSNGLILHPGKQHRLYPLGSNIIIQDVKDGSGGRQEFLQGHSNLITCIAVSRCGNYVASGQLTHMGFQADILVWDFHARKQLRRLSLHKVEVAALAFSPSGKYLVSLGGIDDNSVIVWDTETGRAICGAAASRESSGATCCLAYLNSDDFRFVTGGHCSLRIWDLQIGPRKIKPTDCLLGTLKRNVKCIAVDDADEFMYCGTTTGDLLKVGIKTALFKLSGPPKERDNFSLGVLTCTPALDSKTLVVGAGDGTVACMDRVSLKTLCRTKVEGKVTSIYEIPKQNALRVATDKSNIYEVVVSHSKAAASEKVVPGARAKAKQPAKTAEASKDRQQQNALAMTSARVVSWHYAPVNDIAFPEESSDVFATATDTDIRIWGAVAAQEYLKISLPNLEAKCIIFKKDGRSLLSGWSDGKIRAFGPQSGRLQFVIHDAHRPSVTALAVANLPEDLEDTPDAYRVLSGGTDGQVRVWRVKKDWHTLETAMKEHKGMVTCIKVRKNNKECVSASADGSCIVWDLVRHVRNQVLFAPSFFKAVVYTPDENQLLTGGTDRKVAYWDCYDGSLIREIELSQNDSINALDITKDGMHFVVGGTGKTIRVFKFDEGELEFLGHGHSTDIQMIKISPDQSYIVSVSSDGAVFQWAWQSGNDKSSPNNMALPLETVN